MYIYIYGRGLNDREFGDPFECLNFGYELRWCDPEAYIIFLRKCAAVRVDEQEADAEEEMQLCTTKTWRSINIWKNCLT